MAKAASKKKAPAAARVAKPAQAKSAASKASKSKIPVPVGRKLAVESRRRGTVSVLVQSKPAVAVPRPPPPVVPAIRYAGTPLEVSRQFFEAHRLPKLASALPAALDAAEFVAGAQAQGLGRVLVFPPVKAQRLAFAGLVKELLEAPSKALTVQQQYTTPWLADARELQRCEVRGRPEGAYLLAIADGPYPDDTRDRKAVQLEGRFAALGTTSLTIFEYVVLQRLLAEERQDHRFDQAVESGGHRSGWQWLLDSRTARGAIHAWWNPTKRRVEVGFSPPGHFDSKRGAHPTLIKAL